MSQLDFSRHVEGSLATYKLRGTLTYKGVYLLLDSADPDLDELNLSLRLDITELEAVNEQARDTLIDWIEDRKARGASIEIVGEWPDDLPPSSADSRPPMFSVAPPPIEEQQAKKLTRFCSIRYFRQMYPYRHYPLAVIFADRILETVRLKRVEDLSNVATLLVDVDDPAVEVRAVFPGCVTVPEKTSVDLTADKAVARFWVTPISVSAGELKHAYVEIWYQGRVLERIATPATIVRQKKALFSLLFGVFFPVFSFLLKFFSKEIKEAAPAALRTAFDQLILVLGHPLTISLLFLMLVTLSIVTYFQNTPKEAAPVRSSLSF